MSMGIVMKKMLTDLKNNRKPGYCSVVRKLLKNIFLFKRCLKKDANIQTYKEFTRLKKTKKFKKFRTSFSNLFETLS